MYEIQTLRSRFARRAAALAFVVMAGSLAGQAQAGCGGYAPPAAPAAVDWNDMQAPPLRQLGGLLSTVYHPDTGASMLRVDARDEGRAGIVGTWRFKFISDLGTVIDFGTMQWHSDGTEFTISGGRAPSTGDVCMGSWVQTGSSTYTLNHIALAWASSDSSPPAPTAAYAGPTFIHAVVALNHAQDAFEGPFTIDVYAPDETTHLAHVTGRVMATRFP